MGHRHHRPILGPDVDFGHRMITDRVLTLAVSFVFIYEGLGMSA